MTTETTKASKETSNGKESIDVHGVMPGFEQSALRFRYDGGSSLPKFGSVEELVESDDYRLFCEGRLANPYGLLAWLRDNDPVHFSPTLNSWIVTRYADVFDAFLDRRFLYDRVSASMAALPEDMQVSCAPLGDHVANWLGYTDPPETHPLARPIANDLYS